MAEEHASRKFRLPWTLPVQRVAQRETAPTPFNWRATIRSRLLVCAALFAVWTVSVEARLIYLQVVQYAWMVDYADGQQRLTIDQAAKRGDILDRNGRLLAYSVDAVTIGADPKMVEDPAGTVRQVCEVLRNCDAPRREKLLAALQRTDTRFVPFEKQAPPDVGQRLQALDLPGIAIYKESKRYYPNKSLASHVLGYVGVDNKGLAGVESKFDFRIRGREGRILLQADARRQPLAVREAVLPTAGDSVELTIDRNLQHIAERELLAGIREHNAESGTALIQDPNTGAILALASFPTFNPNSFRAYTELQRKNRAVQDIYEPGSTIKVVTASAALEENLFEATDMMDCGPGRISLPGRTKPITEASNHNYGVISFEDVIVKSSNVCAVKAGLQLGAERLSLYIKRFGFGQVLSPDFRGQTAGMVREAENLNVSDLGSVSMGYAIGVTPLQMASAVSSIANGGTLYEPRLVGAFIRNGQREPVTPRALRRTISAETAATMTQIMEAVVERGTAKAAQIEGYTIAGKTGTAARIVNRAYSNTEYHASFIGFVPSRDPALTVIVVIDSPHGKVKAYGGTIAAPIFKRIAEASLRQLGIGPTINAPSPVIVAGSDREPMAESRALRVDARQAIESGLMPDLRGLSSRQAIKSITSLGLVPRVSGSGVVIEQSPEPGSPLSDREAATVKLGRLPAVVPAGGAPR